MIGIDKVAIGNMALSLIGARSTIGSLDENSAEAAQIKIWYAFALASALQSYNWSFARRRVDLLQYTDDINFPDWNLRYHYPTDCIFLREIENPAGVAADPIPFAIEQDDNGLQSVLTNQESAKGIITSGAVAEVAFTVPFIDVLVAALASRIAFPLTADRNIQKEMYQLFRTLAFTAPALDANEKVDPQPREAEGIRGRA